MLFQSPPAGRGEQGGAHRQVQHGADHHSGGYFFAGGRQSAQGHRRGAHCRGHIFDD